MSKPDQKQRRFFRRPKLGTVIILLILLIVLAVAISYTDLDSDVAFVQHFFNSPSHFTYRGHSDYVSSVAWSPDGKRIASGASDNTVQVWEM